jgi:Zn-finger nucleic acid-binding protein
MGACFDEITLDGKLTTSQVEKKFKEHQDMCDQESGQSYSGRLNMCNGLKFAHTEFESYKKAFEYLDKNCQKWENAIAVRYRESNSYKPDAKLTKLSESLKDLNTKLYALQRAQSEGMNEKLKAVEFIKCPTCKSRLDTRFRQRTLKCPVCDGSFLSATELKKRATLDTKIKEVQAKIDSHRDALQTKADKKSRETRWLIGGVCSS